ncbi:VrrA/YqfQ family protein [Fervidibacillus albus]|uniref:YqfQ family protein n=1 Tax=Fervidibacillus albus TaxID=2980026 RepID=A0A9E8RY95_9BACI|nr:VrrA/YqfQ family protein [Fervidibacillus albus]WAA10397.1 YqfQ family protein [Fervidibacillus albus]
MQPVFQPRPKPFFHHSQPHPPQYRQPDPFSFHPSSPPPQAIGRGGLFRNRLNMGRTNGLGIPMNPLVPTQGTSVGRNVFNLNRISQFLGQTQQVLNTAQQIGPMVQQYGPLIRNLPALWKLYKGVKSGGGKEEDEQETPVQQPEKKKINPELLEEKREKMEKSTRNERNKTVKKKKNRRDVESKPSVPKLYI